MTACWRVLALAALLWLSTTQVHAVALRFEVGSVEHAAFRMQGLMLTVADDGASADLQVERLTVGGSEYRALHVHCPSFSLAYPELHCDGGRFVADGLDEDIRLSFDFDLWRRDGRLSLRAGAEGVDLRLQGGALSARLTAFSIARLVNWLPALAGYSPAGVFDGRVQLAGDASLSLDGVLSGAAFASADGLQAAEGLVLKMDATLRQRGEAQDFSARIGWTAGEAYFHPVYVTAPAALVVAGQMRPDRIELTRIGLEVDGADVIEARATVSLPDGVPQRLAVAVASADLGVLGPRFIAPLIAPSRAAALEFAGRLSAGIVIEQGRLQSFDAVFDDVRYADADTALALGPLTGVAPWRADAPSRLNVHVGGGRWQALELGAFDLEAEVHGESLVVERVEIPLLDGRLVVNALELKRDAAGWNGSGAAHIEPISMPLLTKAIGLPEMGGILSASMPRLRVSPGELALEGALIVSVFDGYLRVTDLTAIEPFGVSSRLFSNLTARNIDLAQLTDTFSFGGMTGFIDIDIDGLELAHWRPIRFDAHVRSAPGRYPRRISQRAVENIGALAGPGAGLALQRSFLRFFEDFGYRQIGLRCRLEGGVCIMGGIGEDASGSFDIVRGGGIPALNIIGYNRRVNWDELVGRVQRVIESNAAPVIR